MVHPLFPPVAMLRGKETVHRHLIESDSPNTSDVSMHYAIKSLNHLFHPSLMVIPERAPVNPCHPLGTFKALEFRVSVDSVRKVCCHAIIKLANYQWEQINTSGIPSASILVVSSS